MRTLKAALLPQPGDRIILLSSSGSVTGPSGEPLVTSIEGSRKALL